MIHRRGRGERREIQRKRKHHSGFRKNIECYSGELKTLYVVYLHK